MADPGWLHMGDPAGSILVTLGGFIFPTRVAQYRVAADTNRDPQPTHRFIPRNTRAAMTGAALCLVFTVRGPEKSRLTLHPLEYIIDNKGWAMRIVTAVSLLLVLWGCRTTDTYYGADAFGRGLSRGLYQGMTGQPYPYIEKPYPREPVRCDVYRTGADVGVTGQIICY